MPLPPGVDSEWRAAHLTPLESSLYASRGPLAAPWVKPQAGAFNGSIFADKRFMPTTPRPLGITARPTTVLPPVKSPSIRAGAGVTYGIMPSNKLQPFARSSVSQAEGRIDPMYLRAGARPLLTERGSPLPWTVSCGRAPGGWSVAGNNVGHWLT